jgi:hypothetical protein
MTKLAAPYHTALTHGTVERAPDLERFALPNGSVAFAHDLMVPLPDIYKKCDVFYLEPPWQAGFKVFNERAGVMDGRQYPRFMQRLGEVLEGLEAPTYILTGKSESRRLPKPSFSYPIAANGYPSGFLCIGYRVESPIVAPTSDALIAQLAHDYGCVGDFTCGYGKAARVFHATGKQFVVSDFVKHCIGVIARDLGKP